MIFKKASLLAATAVLLGSSYAASAANVVETFNLVVTDWSKGIGLGGLVDVEGHSANYELDHLATGDNFEFDVVYNLSNALASNYNVFGTARVSLDATYFNNIYAVFDGTTYQSSLHLTPGGNFWAVSPTPLTIFVVGDNLLKIFGHVISHNGSANLSGSETLSLSINNNIVTVPEPEQWSMILLGFPFVSWMVRRKQAV